VDVSPQEVHKLPDSWICGSAQTVPERDPFFMRGVQMSEVESALVKWNDETSGPWACLASECTQACIGGARKLLLAFGVMLKSSQWSKL
jgi:hypothetical protein